MTEQAAEELPAIYEAPVAPLNTRHVLSNNWAAPARTITLGAIISLLLVYTVPVNSFAYIAILVPICLMTAITQISLGIIHELDEHTSR